MRVDCFMIGAMIAVGATPTLAQSWDRQTGARGGAVADEAWRVAPDGQSRLSAGGFNQDGFSQEQGVWTSLGAVEGFNLTPDARFGPATHWDTPPVALTGAPEADRAYSRRDVWVDGAGFSDRVTLRTAGRLRRADGAPAPAGPMDRAEYEADAYDLSVTRGWEAARGYTASGLEVSLTPHAGVGVGSFGGSAEAGATLRIGKDVSDGLDRVAPDGQERFGERPRWYLYAAGSGRAVGYNFARTRDGDYVRSGLSQDTGVFLGDASVGVAYRRGALHASVGAVYREIEAKGLRAGHGVDNDVSEGLVAFQLSIRPRR